MFNFKETEAAKELSFLTPGVYAMKISDVKLDKFPKGQPYLGLTFTTEEGLSFTEKMGYSSEKAREVFMARLQYLHEAWTNKKLDKAFKSVEEVETYFKKCFVNVKAGTRNIVIGGEAVGKNVYASLPFTNFIVGDDSDLEVGEFTEGDDNWKKYVKKSNRTTAASGQKNGILNEDADDSKDTVAAGGGDDSDETPW